MGPLVIDRVIPYLHNGGRIDEKVGFFQLGVWKVAKLEVAKYEVGNGRCVVGH